MNKSLHYTFSIILENKKVCLRREKVEKGRRESVPRIEHNRLIANLTRPLPIKFVSNKDYNLLSHAHLTQKRVWEKSKESKRKFHFTFFTGLVKLNKSPHYTFSIILENKEVCLRREKVEKVG